MKKNLKISILILIGILLAIIIARYITDENFRYTVDTKILKKELEQDTLSTIEINYESTPSIFAYSKYVAVLNKNSFNIYTQDGSKTATLDINISKPLTCSYGKYMVVAEQSGQKIYLINGESIAWQNDVEGSIAGVNVNKNGYVSVIVTNTTYKSVVVLYNPDGTELFRSYTSSTYAICTSISSNNKYLAIGEVDYSGTIVKSNVKIISIALAQTNPKESVINKYESSTGEVVSNIKYKDKDVALCMFNGYIEKVGIDSSEKYIDIDSDALFVDLGLKDKVAIIEKQSSGLFSYEYEMKIKNINSSSESLYILKNDMPKGLIVSSELIGINLGTEVQIVSTSGILLKTYKSNQEIKSVVIGDSIAGIVYKDKIELIGI
jgi:hypothetical protein